MESSGMNVTANTTLLPETNGSDESRYFGLLVGLIVIFLGTIGNGITVWAYWRNKNLQSSFNVLIANLCLIDLLFTVVVIPFMLPGYVVGENLYSEALCRFISYLYYVAIASSLYNLVAIAINRYIGIVLANRYRKLFTGPRLAVCLTSTWLVPALLYIPLAAGNAYSWDSDVLRCGISNNMPAGIRWYNLTLNIIFQAIPLLILIVAYTAIFRKVKKVKAKMKGHQKSRRQLRSTSSVSSAFHHKSGNTSDETGEELQPSSMVEGIAFKPVHSEQKESAGASQEMSQKAHEGTDEDINSIEKHPSVSTYEEDNEIIEKPISTKRKNSIWNILLQNKTKNLNSNGHALLQKTNSSTAYERATNRKTYANGEFITRQDGEAPLPELIALTQIHRKKSLSTPTLPSFDLDNFNLSRQDSKNSFPIHFRQYQENVKTSNGKIHDNNNEKQMRNRAMSDNTHTANTNSLKAQKKKEKASTPSASDNEISSKTWNRKSTTRKSEKDRQKSKTLKKRRERERQLAYSSFMICIAFAVCILPTSLLYLIRVLTGLVVPSSTILIISCFSWLHAIVNPWIYGYLNMQYRKEYLKIIKLIKSKLCCSHHTSTTISR